MTPLQKFAAGAQGQEQVFPGLHDAFPQRGICAEHVEGLNRVREEIPNQAAIHGAHRTHRRPLAVLRLELVLGRGGGRRDQVAVLILMSQPSRIAPPLP